MRDLRIGLVLMTTIAATGCGVTATAQPVRVDGGRLDINSSQQQAVQPPRPDTASDAAGLVSLYLAAAVGGGEAGIEQVRQFLTQGGRSALQVTQGQPIIVIRLEGEPSQGVPSNDVTGVTMRYRKVAELTDVGKVKILPASEPVAYTFQVRWENNQRRIENPLNGLFLSDSALLEYYQRRSVYFWDLTSTTLVPDLMYLPLTLQPRDRANRVVDAVLSAPSDFLAPVVQPTEPKETKRKDNVSFEGRSMALNLTAQATGDTAKLRRLLIQLRWSLRPDADSIKLLVEGEPQDLGEENSAYQDFNYGATVATADPDRLFIKDGRLQPGSLDGTGPGTPAIPLLGSHLNTSLAAAAMTLNRSRAALVRHSPTAPPNARYALYLLRRDGPPGPKAVITSATMSRPEWVPRTTGADATEVLVAAGGRLYAASEAGHFDLGAGSLTNVTAVSVSSDGRRVALVANKRAYAAVLAVNNRPAPKHSAVSIAEIRPLPAVGQAETTSITWLNEHLLLVAGKTGAGEGRLWQVTVDGATLNQELLANTGIVPDDVIASPAIPPPGPTIAVDVYVSTGGRYQGYFVERETTPARVEGTVDGIPVFLH